MPCLHSFCEKPQLVRSIWGLVAFLIVSQRYIFECLWIQIYRHIMLKAHFTSNRVSLVFLNSDFTDKKMKVKCQARHTKKELMALPFVANLHIKIYIK